MEDIINGLIEYGYLILFLYSFGGGMVALIGASILSFSEKMDLSTSIIVATTANFIGSTLLFYMGRYNKSVLHPYLKNHRRKIALSHVLMKKHGVWIIFFQKFIYGLKTLIPLVAGITKFDFKKFIILNFLSSIVWGLVVGIGAFFASEIVLLIFDKLKNYPFVAPIFILALLFIIWKYLSLNSSKSGDVK